jgi:hypothetical protein
MIPPIIYPSISCLIHSFFTEFIPPTPIVTKFLFQACLKRHHRFDLATTGNAACQHDTSNPREFHTESLPRLQIAALDYLI